MAVVSLLRLLLLLLAVALPLAAPKSTDCPTPCQSKLSSGKVTAICKEAGLINIPQNIDPGTQVLDLSGNNITGLDREIFKRVGLLNLQRISIANATLEDIHADAFRSLTNLVEIDLSHNQIPILDWATFQDNRQLRAVHLNGNPLGPIIQSKFLRLPHLRTLELENCELEFVHKNAFVHSPELESLSLKNNLLTSLDEDTLINCTRLETLLLDGNPWNCDCELRGFRDWFIRSQGSRLRSPSPTCSKPEALVGRNWENVTSEEFACVPKKSILPKSQIQAEAGGNVNNNNNSN